MPAGNSRGEGDDDLQLTAEMISSSDGVEKDEISDCDSTSVSEYRWRPSQEIEEIDEGWTVFSRTSSSRTSVSSFSTTQPQTRRRNWKNWVFRPSDIKGKPTSIVDKSIETIMIGDWGAKAVPFQDEPEVASTAFDHRGYDGIKRIIIYCDIFAIHSMRIQYTKRGKLEWSETVGEMKDADRHKIVLDDPREYITKVKGYISRFGRVKSLTFFTNRETYGPFGTQQRDESRKDVYPFEYSGGKLVGFKGSSYEHVMYSLAYIYSIGFYVQSPPPQSCEKCGGKYIISSATTSTSERVPNVNHQTTREIQQIISVGQFGISKSSFTPFDHTGEINYLKVEYTKNGQPQQTDGIGKMNMKNGEPQLTAGIGDVDMEDSATEVVLDYPNEFLQAVTGTTFGEIYGTCGVSCLTFHSNLKKYGPFGRTVGFPFEVSRGKIIGFQGEASEEGLMAIGFHVVPTKYPISLLCGTCEADV